MAPSETLVPSRGWSEPELFADVPFDQACAAYRAALLLYFQKQVLSGRLTYQRLPIRFRIEPQEDGLPQALYHLATQADQPASGSKTPENQRVYQEGRCCRVSWIVPMLRGADRGYMRVWSKEHRGQRGISTRVHICDPLFTQLIILEVRADCFQFVTTFPLKRGSRYAKKMQKDYEKAKAAAPR